MPRSGDDVAAGRAVRTNDADAPHLGVRPRGVDDPLAVAREGREEFQSIVFRDPTRLARRQRLHIEPAERAVDNALAIGRHTHVAQHADREFVRIDLLRKPQRLVDGLFDASGERNRRSPSGRRVHLPDLSFAPDHERAAVGRPGVLRIHAVDGPGFLEILVDVAKELAIAAALEIPKEERTLQAHPPHVGERLPVGRHLRRDRPALHADGAPLAAGDEIAPHHRVDGAVRIAVVFEGETRTDVLAVIEVAAVGRDVGLAVVLLPADALGHLEAVGGARRVIHPDFAGAERPLLDEVPPRIDVFAVGRPGRAVDEPALFARHLPRIPALGVNRPDIPQAVSIAADRDALAVGTEARLHVEGGTGRQPRRGRRAGAVDRHRVDVAEQIEDDALAVGTHVHVHPRPFRRVERQLRRRAELGGDVPALLRRGLCGDARRHRDDRGAEDEGRGAVERLASFAAFPRSLRAGGRRDRALIVETSPQIPAGDAAIRLPGCPRASAGDPASGACAGHRLSAPR